MSRKVVCLCHVVVMLGLFAVQAIHSRLRSSPLKPMNDFADEGLWNHNARCKALFGSFMPDDLSLALVAAPLFTALQWLVFSVCGVSYFSARLICLVSLWLIMLMVYYLMGRQFSWGVGLLAAATLGVAQEMLMYTNWATPVMPEMMFLTAVLFFWELGRTGSRRWMAVSGACFIAALLSKMTSLQVLPALAVFLAGSYWLRKDIDMRRLRYFVLSAGVLGLLTGLCYLPFLHSWAFVSRNLWQNVWNFQNPDVKELGGGLIHIWFLAPMTCPGGFLLTMLLSLWFVDAIVRAVRHGFRVRCGKYPRSSSIRCAGWSAPCWCWWSFPTNRRAALPCWRFRWAACRIVRGANPRPASRRRTFFPAGGHGAIAAMAGRFGDRHRRGLVPVCLQDPGAGAAGLVLPRPHDRPQVRLGARGRRLPGGRRAVFYLPQTAGDRQSASGGVLHHQFHGRWNLVCPRQLHNSRPVPIARQGQPARPVHQRPVGL